LWRCRVLAWQGRPSGPVGTCRLAATARHARSAPHAPALTALTLKLAFEKMLTYGNHLGLYAEQISRTGQQ
jgi:hypothetical protein